jgi:hypothetical protein
MGGSVERRFVVRAVTDVSSNTIEYGGVFLLLEIQQVLNGFVILIVVLVTVCCQIQKYEDVVSQSAVGMQSLILFMEMEMKSIMEKNSLFMFSLGSSHILES